MRHSRAWSVLRIGAITLLVGGTFGPDGHPARADDIVTVRFEQVRERCARGERVGFTIGSMTLYVDPHIVNHAEFEAEVSAEGCPRGPFPTQTLSFKRNNPFRSVSEAWNAAGLPLYWLKIWPPTSPLDGAKIPTDPASRHTLPGGTTIEDITALVEPASPDNERFDYRVYRLQQPVSANGTRPQPTRLACFGSGPVPRVCRSVYDYRPDARIEYEFLQSGVTARNSWGFTLRGPVGEPDDFIDVDASVRNWLAGLEQAPP
jgi:hypothetical protein